MIAFAAPLGLLGLLAIPAIIAIHVFRRRFKPRRVTALFLWPAPSQVASAGRTREKLLFTSELWCQLLAALALTAWLSQPRFSLEQTVEHLIVVLDDRASLQARVLGGTVAERLHFDLDQRLAALSARDRVTLIVSGTVPRVLAGPLAEPEAARALLAHWDPTSAWHPLDSALVLAQHLAGDGSSAGQGRVLVASDRRPSDMPPTFGLIARGRPASTSGLGEARWIRQGPDRLVLRLSGTGPRDGDILVGTRIIATVSLTTATSVLVDLPDSAVMAGTVEVRLKGDDPLVFDDTVILHRPPTRTVRVAVDVSGSVATLISRALAQVPEVSIVHESADLRFAGGPPAPQPGTWGVNVSPGSSQATMGPFLARRGHPVVVDLDGQGCIWLGGLPGASLALDWEVLLAGGGPGADCGKAPWWGSRTAPRGRSPGGYAGRPSAVACAYQQPRGSSARFITRAVVPGCADGCAVDRTVAHTIAARGGIAFARGAQCSAGVGGGWPDDLAAIESSGALECVL